MYRNSLLKLQGQKECEEVPCSSQRLHSAQGISRRFRPTVVSNVRMWKQAALLPTVSHALSQAGTMQFHLRPIATQ